MSIKYAVVFFIGSIFLQCAKAESEYLPKPKGFNRIALPAHQYQLLKGDYPYIFEYSKSAKIVKDVSPGAEPYWILVEYPTLNAKIQFTYKALNGSTVKLDRHIADAFRLAAKHQIKAISQTDQIVQLPKGKRAVVIEIEGAVPSHYQFYITDTTKNFLRGAAYLNRATENDSLMPIVNYLKVDCRKILETLNWKK